MKDKRWSASLRPVANDGFKALMGQMSVGSVDWPVTGKRPSKGWRRHVRRRKANKRQDSLGR